MRNHKLGPRAVRLMLSSLVLSAVLGACTAQGPTPTVDSGSPVGATPTPTSTVAAEPTDTPTVEALSTPVVTMTPTPNIVQAPTPQPTLTPIPTPTATRAPVNIDQSSAVFQGRWGQAGRSPGEFYIPRGIAIARSGDVYVADTFNERIQVFNAGGQFLREWEGPGGRLWGIDVDDQGRVFVAVADKHVVIVYSSNGDVIGTIDGVGTQHGALNYPFDVAVGPNGYIYVADTFNYRIEVFDSNFQFLFGFTNMAGDHLERVSGVTVDAWGNVYAIDNRNRVVKFTATGRYVTDWGDPGSRPGQFNDPQAIATDMGGNVYVVDYENHRVQMFTSNGRYIREWGGFGTADGKFRYARGIAVAEDGTIYVADSNNDRIQIIGKRMPVYQAIDPNLLPQPTPTPRPSRDLVTAWGAMGNVEGQFNFPRGIAVGGGFVYVADTFNLRIQKFTKDGKFVKAWPSPGGQLWGIAAGEDGFVYATDPIAGVVYKFSSEGVPLHKWGSRGPRDGQFDNPFGIAVGPDGRVYVADTFNNRIQVFTSDGAFLGKFGEFGSAQGKFNAVRGVAVDLRSNVYVLDGGNARVQKFDSNWAFVETWGSNGTGAGQLNYATGIGVDGNGFTYVADYHNHRIDRFDDTGKALSTFGGKFGSALGLMRFPRAVAVDWDGTVYVADSNNDRVQVFR